MKKFLIAIIFALNILPLSVQARVCAKSDMVIEFSLLKYSTAKTPYSARITATLDVPNPSYTYTLEFAPINHGGVLHGTLEISASPDMDNVQIFSPMEIIENTLIPRGVRGVFVDVVKPYSGSPEYFMANFTDQFKSENTLCLSPEMYK